MVDFAKLRNLNVDAGYMWNRWRDNDWKNVKDKPVLPHWKLHLWTHHRYNEEKNVRYNCHICRKTPAPYIKGHGSEGHALHYCHVHRPPEKPLPPEIGKMVSAVGVIPPEAKPEPVYKQRKKLLKEK